MKKKLLSVLSISLLFTLIIYFITSENNKGITLSIKNKSKTTINNINISLYNSEDNFIIYTLDNVDDLNTQQDLINIRKYPNADYGLKVDFIVLKEQSENFVAYLPSMNGKYKLDIEVQNINNNLIANIKYKDSLQESIQNIIIR